MSRRRYNEGEMTPDRKRLWSGLFLLLICPLFFSLGDIFSAQAGVHFFAGCLYFWSIVLGVCGFIACISGGATWGDYD